MAATNQTWKQFETKHIQRVMLNAVKSAAEMVDRAFQTAMERAIRVVFAGIGIAFLSIMLMATISIGDPTLTTLAIIGTAFLLFAALDWIFESDSSMFTFVAAPTLIVVWAVVWSAIVAGASTDMIFDLMAANANVWLVPGLAMLVALMLGKMIVELTLSALTKRPNMGEIVKVVHPGVDPVIDPLGYEPTPHLWDRLGQRLKTWSQARFTPKQVYTYQTIIAFCLLGMMSLIPLGVGIYTQAIIPPVSIMMYAGAVIALLIVVSAIFILVNRHKATPFTEADYMRVLDWNDERRKFVLMERINPENGRFALACYRHSNWLFTSHEWKVTDNQTGKSGWYDTEYHAFRGIKRVLEREAQRAKRNAQKAAG